MGLWTNAVRAKSCACDQRGRSDRIHQPTAGLLAAVLPDEGIVGPADSQRDLGCGAATNRDSSSYGIWKWERPDTASRLPSLAF
jgi:hypothetical protein